MDASPHAVVLDAGPVVDFMLGEPGGEIVAGLLHEGTVRMATINLAEVVDVLVRVYGVPADDAVPQVAELAGLVHAVAPSLETALRAGELRARAFRRSTSRLSLADCFVVATARPGDNIATRDAALLRLARQEGIEVVDPGHP